MKVTEVISAFTTGNINTPLSMHHLQTPVCLFSSEEKYSIIPSHLPSLSTSIFIHIISFIDPDKAVDVLSIRSVLMSLFKDADDENVKQLTADKFKNALMKFDQKLTKFLLRLSIKELAMVISEADGAGADGGGADDGMVDYDEFVAFGADLLICLRGRDLGRIMTMKADVAMDANIRSIMHKQDLHRIVNMTNRQFLHADHAKTGYLKLLDVRPILFGMSAHGLSDVEVTLTPLPHSFLTSTSLHKIPSHHNLMICQCLIWYCVQ